MKNNHQHFRSTICLCMGFFLLAADTGAEEFLLEAPDFVAAKIAATAQTPGTAFPVGEAGIAAYVKVTQTIGIAAVQSIYQKVEGVGDNYIFGTVSIPNFVDTLAVHLYIDADGWIIAYLTRSEPVAKMMQWLPADVDNPRITTIPRNTLTDVLNRVENELNIGVGVLSQVKYYNFKFPEATTVTIAVKTRNDDGANLMQVEIPANYTLYEASYYHYTFAANDSQLKVDGTLVSDAPDVDRGKWAAVDSYKGAITVGRLNTIEISYDNYDSSYPGSAGVATALVYKAGG